MAKENNENERKILDGVLAQFGMFFDSIVPKAFASDMDSNMEVNELFTDYIGEQFIAIKDEQEEYGDDMEDQMSKLYKRNSEVCINNLKYS
ncbi:hypothetical protein [Psychromonas sp. KJ10-2]|uniref:hypothetical protein n=1 Tax=Psychromonas sp. KJ10-2 TaxID=3391822 RepID=UPI0039B4CBB1